MEINFKTHKREEVKAQLRDIVEKYSELGETLEFNEYTVRFKEKSLRINYEAIDNIHLGKINDNRLYLFISNDYMNVSQFVDVKESEE